MPKSELWVAFRYLVFGAIFPMSHTLWIRDRSLETAWGPLHVLVVFLCGWGLVGVLESGVRSPGKKVLLIVGGSYGVTWVLWALSSLNPVRVSLLSL